MAPLEVFKQWKNMVVFHFRKTTLSRVLRRLEAFCRNSDRRGYLQVLKDLQVICFGILFKKKNTKF